MTARLALGCAFVVAAAILISAALQVYFSRVEICIRANDGAPAAGSAYITHGDAVIYCSQPGEKPAAHY